MNQIQKPKARAQSGPDTSEQEKLKKYKVELGFTQYSYAEIIIEAASLPEARKKADKIESDEIDFKPTDGYMDVNSISQLADDDSSQAEDEEGNE